MSPPRKSSQLSSTGSKRAASAASLSGAKGKGKGKAPVQPIVPQKRPIDPVDPTDATRTPSPEMEIEDYPGEIYYTNPKPF